MTLILSTAEPIWFEPTDQAGLKEAERIAYQLAVPMPYSWAALDRAIRARGAVQHSGAKILKTLKDGIAALLADPADQALRDDFLGKIAALEAAANSKVKFDKLTEEERKEFIIEALKRAEDLENLANVVRRGYATYAELEGDNEFYLDVVRLETARFFVTGWRNIPADFATRSAGGLPDELLRFIPAEHLWQIRRRVTDLRFPTETERKNSVSPSPGLSARRSSTAKNTTPRKTRGKAKTITGPSPKSDSPSSASIPST